MNLSRVSENPESLENLFAILEGTALNFDKEEIKTFLFEYACRVCEIEGLRPEEKATDDFREFLMRNELRDIVHESSKGGILCREPTIILPKRKNPNFSFRIHQELIMPKLVLDLKKAVQDYQTDTHAKYVYYVFQKSGFSKTSSKREYPLMPSAEQNPTISANP